ncbi:serine hydrolase domain-containing protein [Gimesia sp.]|uniref:serine hydrolase domain-containing protein n=1 Tax=Gimesia sp. TaxID=2024833 RepID=UPI003A8E25DC
MSRFISDHWQKVEKLIDEFCQTDQVPAIALRVVAGDESRSYFSGRRAITDQSATLTADTIFLVASITKPIVVSGVLKLLEEGELLLGDRVKRFIPEFGCAGKHGITLRHLMTHTSGLPDMLPDNQELRAANAPLSEFVRQICELTPDEPPGRMVQYQSTGIAILGEVISRITGQSCADYLRQSLFEPLQMSDTALGLPDEWTRGENPRIDRIAEIRIPAELDVEPHWDWNSSYWRQFGAPWGGLLTTPADLSKFAGMLRAGGRYQDQQILSPQTIREATRDQLPSITGLSFAARQGKGWGLGWQIVSAFNSDYYGDLLSRSAFGHGGATGTVFWVDPELDASAIIVTTEPQEPHGRYLSRITNQIVASIEPV